MLNDPYPESNRVVSIIGVVLGTGLDPVTFGS